jgi:NAD+ diphosphatase
MSFIQEFRLPERIDENALWFLAGEQKLLIRRDDDSYRVPMSIDLKEVDLVPLRPLFIGRLDGIQCYASEFSGTGTIPEGFVFKGITFLSRRIEDELFWIAGLANQIVYWEKSHRYCGRCGNTMEDKADERAKQCAKCGLVNYPRLSPAIIVAILKDNKILLAHSERFPAEFYSVLAGFVEPGENLEECVRREIREEVGIDVKNIRYFGSQPWPFPDSLMIAFTAEYSGGEIKVDNSEILDAGWFLADNLPSIPPKISIARKLIDWYLKKFDQIIA